MSDKPTLEELLEVQEYFGLPSPALVEKDWHVVGALAAIAAIDPGEFRLVFGGGTALGRAFKLTRRMSEDVDLKIVSKSPPSRGVLRKLRTDISNALLRAGFAFNPQDEKYRISMYKGHYTKYMLPYEPVAQGEGLRSHVQIETSVWPLRRDPISKSVISFVAEAYGARPNCRRSPVPPFSRPPPKSSSRSRGARARNWQACGRIAIRPSCATSMICT